MIIAGMDISTTSGLCVWDGKGYRAYEFRPNVKRPSDLKPQELHAPYEAIVAEEWRDHVRRFFLSEGVEHVGYELPRTGDFSKFQDDGEGGKEKVRSSSNLSLVRNFGLVTHMLGVANRLNIIHYGAHDTAWRKTFLGFSRAPKGHPGFKTSRDYMKAQSKLRCAQLGIKVKGDNAADATGVCYWLKSYLDPDNKVMGELFEGSAP